MAAAAVYATLRCNGHARLLEAVSELVPVANERVLNAFRVLNRELELPVPPSRPIDHVPRIVSELGLGRDVEREARRLAEQAVKAGVANGRNPAGVAAGCVRGGRGSCGAGDAGRDWRRGGRDRADPPDAVRGVENEMSFLPSVLTSRRGFGVGCGGFDG